MTLIEGPCELIGRLVRVVYRRETLPRVIVEHGRGDELRESERDLSWSRI